MLNTYTVLYDFCYLIEKLEKEFSNNHIIKSNLNKSIEFKLRRSYLPFYSILRNALSKIGIYLSAYNQQRIV